MKALLMAALAVSISQMMFGQTTPAADSGETASSGWNQLVDNFFDDFFKLNPTQGTAAGFHQYEISKTIRGGALKIRLHSPRIIWRG